MQKAIIASVTSLCVLGLLGGCLIVVGDGYTASGKRGGWQVFVPAPQAYILAAIMFSMSGLALLWLAQQATARKSSYVIAGVAYVGVAALLIWSLR